MANRLREWWTLHPEEERQSADNPLTPLSDAQRRNTLPLLTLAFGWGFLVTGLLTGGELGKGMSFWPEAVQASFFGNLANSSLAPSLDTWATRQHAIAVCFIVCIWATGRLRSCPFRCAPDNHFGKE